MFSLLILARLVALGFPLSKYFPTFPSFLLFIICKCKTLQLDILYFSRSEDNCKRSAAGLPNAAGGDDAHLFLPDGVRPVLATNLHGFPTAEMCTGHRQFYGHAFA